MKERYYATLRLAMADIADANFVVKVDPDTAFRCIEDARFMLGELLKEWDNLMGE